ncbi:MAG: multidrug transporter ATP-binding protein, partial [Devosia sp.]|nr:multidrug transporter ATP-binding protein [Devosia sp.]
MSVKKLPFRADAFRHVLGFTFRHWGKQKLRAALIGLLVLAATLAEAFSPVFAGRLVDAVASGSGQDHASWMPAVTAFWMMSGLYLSSVILRQFVFFNVISFTLKIMDDVIADAFVRVQRFSTDWHANSFAGSTVRKITRGAGALDLLNDTLLTALWPSLVMLLGATFILGAAWPVMGLVVGLGSLIFVAITVWLSVSFVAPAGALANAWDTKMGGALADAVSCNAVVKAFGAETREEAILHRVVGKWRKRTARVWRRGTLNGGAQGLMMALMQGAILGTALVLWSQGAASPGDITFVLTMFFVLQGHLRDVGQHIRNLQRSVNDMEELVDLERQPVGIEDRPGAKPIRISAGAIAFKDVTFRYGSHVTPLYRDFSVTIAPGERVGLVGHSGSGKTTFVKLIQRLYDINSGEILVDGQNIAQVQQSSLRAQIAIVQQEPILFHRTLAENIAYARPGASRAEIEQAAMQANAHDFI